MTLTPIRIVIADDHALFREGLKSLVRLRPIVEIVGEAADLKSLDAVLATTTCDILLLDLQMEKWSMDEIPRLARQTSVIMLTANESVDNGITALRMGARAIVQKRFAFETLISAIIAVADGQVWVPPAIQGALVIEGSTPRKLTERELEIVRFVGTGLRNSEVAERLSLSENTIKTHLTNIFDKLGVRDRMELILYAISTGLVSVKDR
jgi:DNA-binding NarL/FixJ family response regulator